MTSRFRLGKKKPHPWNFGKKTMNKKNTTLGAVRALEKTMKKKTTTLGAFEKFKKKTMALKVQPIRRKRFWELWKKP
jgi:hypothetical protein